MLEAFFFGVFEGIGFCASTLVITYVVYLWWKIGREA